MKVELLAVNKLSHIEGFSRKRVIWLKVKIQKEGLWRIPIRVEKNHLLVLDGQHRLEVAKELGLLWIPAVLHDYSEVKVWSLRLNHIVSPALVIKKVHNGEIYPYKTVKHRFPGSSVVCSFKLIELQNDKPAINPFN